MGNASVPPDSRPTQTRPPRGDEYRDHRPEGQQIDDDAKREQRSGQLAKPPPGLDDRSTIVDHTVEKHELATAGHPQHDQPQGEAENKEHSDDGQDQHQVGQHPLRRLVDAVVEVRSVIALAPVRGAAAALAEQGQPRTEPEDQPLFKIERPEQNLRGPVDRAGEWLDDGDRGRLIPICRCAQPRSPDSIISPYGYTSFRILFEMDCVPECNPGWARVGSRA